MEKEKKTVNILLLVTGSIAAVKVGLLLDQLVDEACSVRIAATKSAFHFITRAQHSRKGIQLNRILTDEDEWKEWQGMNDAVMHIELRRWADIVVIAPLDANTLAKLAVGMCDNLVTCVMRAWEVRKKPVVLCPAMNTAMWTHPVTAQQLRTLCDWYGGDPSQLHIDVEEANEEGFKAVLPNTLETSLFQIVGPVKKRLACGDVGIGGMAPVEEVARAIKHTASLIRAARATPATTLENETNKNGKGADEPQ
ncbi:phosphopantothenoylcysteine decarboxylase, putative [Trypanosoma equiperdum]|uniref:Flavoprotein domain-containing protein n=2 Tax=Trypanozoon TaxID=39700 RepID=Q583P0_TRYB2|nr:hypothetical protein, conserved [Trypanosoma brucei brucei TREU927]AAX80997.1 hypothetical protein, conserved [Trypanosoma brucei]AAZ11856.1 hypothetical protein, conserved [Trypanosoma brucei brucei TREU927]SCU67671.1 phosphopantothenoylcysteine decarboxylase, putative [Trypanosoma equiperdum]